MSQPAVSATPPFLLRFGFEESAQRAPKRCHVEHATTLEAQSQPEAPYGIALDPPALHAVRMPVRVVGDIPLLHARLALRAITSTIRHSTLHLLVRTIPTADASCRDCDGAVSLT